WLLPVRGAAPGRAGRRAGGGGAGRRDVDRRDLSRVEPSVGRPHGRGGFADRGDGHTPDRSGLLGLYGADASCPACERGSHKPAAASTMDRDRPGELVLVWPTVV